MQLCQNKYCCWKLGKFPFFFFFLNKQKIFTQLLRKQMTKKCTYIYLFSYFPPSLIFFLNYPNIYFFSVFFFFWLSPIDIVCLCLSIFHWNLWLTTNNCTLWLRGALLLIWYLDQTADQSIGKTGKKNSIWTKLNRTIIWPKKKKVQKSITMKQKKKKKKLDSKQSCFV